MLSQSNNTDSSLPPSIISTSQDLSFSMRKKTLNLPPSNGKERATATALKTQISSTSNAENVRIGSTPNAAKVMMQKSPTPAIPANKAPSVKIAQIE